MLWRLIVISRLKKMAGTNTINLSEYFLGGLGACGACLFTNPLEVVKTRMQLQGELRLRGSYSRHYRNVFHAFFTIGKVDGLRALQKGLIPGLWYQLFMNGVRLGTYQTLVNFGMTKNSEGEVSLPKSVAAGAFSGCVGAVFGSPFYLVSMMRNTETVWYNTKKKTMVLLDRQLQPLPHQTKN